MEVMDPPVGMRLHIRQWSDCALYGQSQLRFQGEEGTR